MQDPADPSVDRGRPMLFIWFPFRIEELFACVNGGVVRLVVDQQQGQMIDNLSASLRIQRIIAVS